MGKRSVKEDKNIYFQSREDAGLTRERASELMDCISASRIAKIETSSLSQIILGMLASLNSLNTEKERLIEITADGKISDDELADFVKIQDKLDKISITVESLKIWVSETIASGEIDEEKLNDFRKKFAK